MNLTRRWTRSLTRGSAMKEKMKKSLTFLLLFFVAALLFTAQAQSTKGIRKVESSATASGPRSALVIGNANLRHCTTAQSCE